MADRIDASRENVERILQEGVRDGSDRKALRHYLIGSEGGRGNAKFHERSGAIICRIRRVLEAHVPDTRSVLQRREEKLAELAEHREKGKLSPFDLDLNDVAQLMKTGGTLTRRDMQHESGLQALVLTRADFDVIGTLKFVHRSYGELSIEPQSLHSDDVLILYPRQVADVPAKTADQEVSEQVVQTEIPEIVGELQLQAALFEIFGAEASTPPPEQHAEWNEILAVHGKMLFQAISLGRAKRVPDVYLHHFAYTRMSELLVKKQYGMVARQLKNLRFGTPEQQAAVERIAAALDPQFATELEAQQDAEEAKKIVSQLFSDVPSRETLMAEAPEFWNTVTPASRKMPAGVIIDARAAGLDEKHIRGFAVYVLEGVLKTADYAWIARFLQNMNLGTPEAIASFERLEAKFLQRKARVLSFA
jgi:hypothetical protein